MGHLHNLILIILSSQHPQPFEMSFPVFVSRRSRTVFPCHTRAVRYLSPPPTACTAHTSHCSHCMLRVSGRTRINSHLGSSPGPLMRSNWGLMTGLNLNRSIQTRVHRDLHHDFLGSSRAHVGSLCRLEHVPQLDSKCCLQRCSL